jgi:hypothetical protein
MTPDQLAAAQLDAVVDQARAAWSAADAAWVQAIATPVGIFVALVAAFYAPWWMRRQEEKRTKILAVNRAGQAVGAIMAIRRMAEEPELAANVRSNLPIEAIRHALARLESLPRDSLSMPHIDTALTVLELHLRAALEAAPVVLEKLQQGPLSQEIIANLDQTVARVQELHGDVCRAAGVRLGKGD